MKTLVLTLAALVAISGCSMMGQGGKQQSLVGTWTGDSTMGEMTMTFNDDGTTHVSMTGGGMDMEMDGKYEVNYDADPMTIDQFGFDDSMMGDMRYLGIFKFVDANTIMMNGNVDSMGGRPTDYAGDMAMELKRQ